MLDIGNAQCDTAKCFFTHVHLPQVINDRQPPTKNKPFSCLFDRPFIHTVDILCPDSIRTDLEGKLKSITGTLRYAKVYLKLKDIVEGDFFNHYIKAGDIHLRSSGRAGVDNTFSLHNGVLRMELEKRTYERAGLVGKPIPSPGKKHAKSRYAIELNLRLPSMTRGHKLFNRMIYAFEHALTDTLTWLFFDLRDHALNMNEITITSTRPTTAPEKTKQTPAGQPAPDSTSEAIDSKTGPATAQENRVVEAVRVQAPLRKHQPFVRDVEPQVLQLGTMETPEFPTTFGEDDKLPATELLEWLCLALDGCPRLLAGHQVDSTISRYAVPNLTSAGDDDTLGSEPPSSMDEAVQTPTPVTQVADLSRIRYHGFLPPPVVAKVFTTAIKTTSKAETWFAMRLQGFGDQTDCTILVKDNRAMIWEYS